MNRGTYSEVLLLKIQQRRHQNLRHKLAPELTCTYADMGHQSSARSALLGHLNP